MKLIATDCSKSIVASNLFFTPPLIITLQNGLNIPFLIALLSISTSTLYHLAHEKRFLMIDRIAALALFANNMVLLYLAKASWYEIATVAGLIFLALLFFYREDRYGYELNHFLWHLFSAMVSTFCLITFVY
jgi:hypothetical protein